MHISEDHADALQDVGFSGAVGAGRGEDALGSHVLEFENSFVAAAEVDSLETLRMRRSPTRAITIPESGCARQSSPWWNVYSGAASITAICIDPALSTFA